MVAKNIGGNIACWLRSEAMGETLKAVKVRVIPPKTSTGDQYANTLALGL